MAAQCAICLAPIGQGTKFVLAGTEVFHDRCAAQHGTHMSVGEQRKQRLAYLEASNTDTKRALENIATEQRVLKAKVVEEMEHEISRRKDMEESAHSWRRRYEAARADLERTTVERDRTMRELALTRQYGVDTKPDTPEQKPRDARDDTEIRFSLLEIDSD